MHSYLKSIGYRNIKNQTEIEDLIYKTIAEADGRREYKREDGTAIIEYVRYTSEICGIIVRGEKDNNDDFHFGHYYPFCTGAAEVNVEEEIYIGKKVDTDAYTGMCDDSRIGISLIFYLINTVDYFENFSGEKCVVNQGIKYAALAESGKIILPTLVHEKDSEKLKKESKKKNHLIAEAKKGNQEAIENLTLEEIDRYAMVSLRIRNEDILSIVDTSIVPYGAESDLYKITGNIEACRSVKNKDTGERIWHLTISCNEIPFDIYINEEDLMGEPAVGRRFRGNVWLQGLLVPNKE